MERKFLAGVSALALLLAGSQATWARKSLRCADEREVTAMQAAAVQQELMDAALACGDTARENFNAFQTSFGPELRRSDAVMLRMFRRIDGRKRGDAAYNLFKTDLASKAELRRVHDARGFCAEANAVVAAALQPVKPALADFVSGIQVAEKDSGPVDSCAIEVAVSLKGAQAAPAIVPRPNPLRVAMLPPAPVSAMAAPAPVIQATPAPAAAAPAAPPPAQTADNGEKKKSSGWLSGLFH